MENPRENKDNLKESHKHLILAIIAGARRDIGLSCDSTFDGQKLPLSKHLDLLELAVLKDDIEAIKKYSEAEAGWFPYCENVSLYLGILG